MRYDGAKLWNMFWNFTDVNSIYSFKERFKDILLDNNSLDFLYLTTRNVSRYQDMTLLLIAGFNKIQRDSILQDIY